MRCDPAIALFFVARASQQRLASYNRYRSRGKPHASTTRSGLCTRAGVSTRFTRRSSGGTTREPCRAESRFDRFVRQELPVWWDATRVAAAREQAVRLWIPGARDLRRYRSAGVDAERGCATCSDRAGKPAQCPNLSLARVSGSSRRVATAARVAPQPLEGASAAGAASGLSGERAAECAHFRNGKSQYRLDACKATGTGGDRPGAHRTRLYRSAPHNRLAFCAPISSCADAADIPRCRRDRRRIDRCGRRPPHAAAGAGRARALHLQSRGPRQHPVARARERSASVVRRRSAAGDSVGRSGRSHEGFRDAGACVRAGAQRANRAARDSVFRCSGFGGERAPGITARARKRPACRRRFRDPRLHRESIRVHGAGRSVCFVFDVRGIRQRRCRGARLRLSRGEYTHRRADRGARKRPLRSAGSCWRRRRDGRGVERHSTRATQFCGVCAAGCCFR